jgi:exodeoxyribonuclease V alpha subunit
LTALPADEFDVRLVRAASGLLHEFNAAGVLAAADVHVAARLSSLAGETSDPVRLACALAVRAPRLGHVYVDLETVRETAAVEDSLDVAALPWPEPREWIPLVAGSRLVAVGDDLTDGQVSPLRLADTRLYLDRYLREELQVAADLTAFAAAGRLRIIAGGPGTGKTTMVATIVAQLLAEALAAGEPEPLIALAAPTGKAAARLQEAVPGQTASTLHRLLGARPDSRSRFRHNRSQRLPHDVVIVDETSMVSLSLMARLLEAIRPDARLILVGDPDQLVSIEAGAVLGDIVAAGGDTIAVLDRTHRFGGGIAELAAAIRGGDGDDVMAVLERGPDGVVWLPVDPQEGFDSAALAALRDAAIASARAVLAAAQAGDGPAALTVLGGFRLLCAHRRGPQGVATWTARIERWLAEAVPGFEAADPWYVGRPLLVTENDYELSLFNGDTGVVIARGEERVAVFQRGAAVLEYEPAKLSGVGTVHAMTIHKSQGSQFGTAAVLLPEPDARILTRELLYTAATRAQRRLLVAGTAEAVRAAVARPVARASGLSARLRR